jgi:hypothetical protein
LCWAVWLVAGSERLSAYCQVRSSVCVCVCVCERERERERESVGLSVSRVFISVPSIHPFHSAANRECITRGQCVNFTVRFISCVHMARTEQVNVGLEPSGHYTYRTVVTIRTAHWSLYVPPV